MKKQGMIFIGGLMIGVYASYMYWSTGEGAIPDMDFVHDQLGKYSLTGGRNESAVMTEVGHERVKKKGKSKFRKGLIKIDDTYLQSRGRFTESKQEHFEMNETPPQPLDLSQIECNKKGPRTLQLDCKKRLPQAIGIGAKKSGTGALNFFLGGHPAVPTCRKKEKHFWDQNANLGVSWYRNSMPVSSQYQLTFEKSPSYFVGESFPAAMARDVSPELKLVLIIRDPVKRAISDYVHVTKLFPNLKRTHVSKPGHKPLYPHKNVKYIVYPKFENSVLLPNKSVMANNAFIFTGMYSEHVRNWLKVFPLEQIFIIDGEKFVKEPLPILQDLENFLGLPKYFDESSLYFDKSKGFYCLAKPKKKCPTGKGRKHPDIRNNVLKKLYDFYRPYNEELERLTNRTYSWSGM